MGTVIRGLIAGLTGTAALNAATYLDIAVRARPPSRTPEESVQRLADTVGVGLGRDSREAGNRKVGLGALLGYAMGVGTAVTFATLTRHRPVRWPKATLALAALAMAGANGPMAMLGITDPRRWSAADWAADVLPHLAYGAAAASVLAAPRRRAFQRRR
ncbi:hypothetical protein [Allorhizocola rhizosphaerae]|uniref:hypothetical protein n=1 Tax=Allorhizocola rhizosphaerae TaxID=1872709 RepID=UPI000E3CEC6E|nr:hypothetical protein [Allorhizocola rhizosphaerae]